MDEDEDEGPGPIYVALAGGDLSAADAGALEERLAKDWSAAELAVVLRTTLRAVYARLQRGGLPKPRRIGRRLLFNRKEVLSWIERQ